MAETTSLYLNGLGDGSLGKRELWLLERQRSAGINVVTANINWRSAETFPELRDRIGKQTQELLKTTSRLSKFILNGTSAGVCLALAVAYELDDPRINVVGHSGRVRAGDLARWDMRTMERCAHLGTNEESRSFYDGVSYCESVVLPNMPQAQKARTTLTTPLGGIDLIVPGNTMPIQGVNTIVVPAVGHVWAIGHGMYIFPEIVEQLTA